MIKQKKDTNKQKKEKKEKKQERVQRQVVSKNVPLWKTIDNLCFLSKNLYNRTNYVVRQSFIKTKLMPSEYDLTTKFAARNNSDYRALPAQVSQQVIKVLFKNWKSFFESIKEYKENPNKFTGKPGLPKYKHKKDGRNIVIFPAQNLKIVNGFIHFTWNIIPPIKTTISKGLIKQVRIVPQTSCYIIEIVYKYEEKKKNENLKKEKCLSIDFGVNNLITTINNAGLRPFIINGRIIKSINQYYNKEKARLQSLLPKGQYTSNRIKKLGLKRQNWINTYFHRVSKVIVQYCSANNIGRIIVGYNEQWKTETNKGKINNQNFVNIPFLKLLNMIRYKAEEIGIEVKQHEESYTSKCDHFAYQTMTHHEEYLGKRKKRGLFQSSTGKLINADINGAIGIMRKVIGNSVIQQIIDSGFTYNPIKINDLSKINYRNYNIINKLYK